MTWIIVRTDLAKEAFVAAAIERMGFQAWLPVQVRHFRTTGRRRHRTIIETPLLPKTLLACVPPEQRVFLHRIRHFTRLECDAYALPLEIPDDQVIPFRVCLDRENAQEVARINAGRRNTKKKKWEKLTPQNFPEVMQALFGVEQQEQAA